MNLTLGNYLAQNAELEPELFICIDGELVVEVEVVEGYVELLIPVSNHESDIYDVEIKTNCYFNPQNIGINDDTRDLSIALYYIGS